MSRSVKKGTAAESAIVAYLKPWWSAVERRAKTGNKDRGDIAGVVGQRGKVVIESKDCVRVELAQWSDEARIERENDGADVGVVWFKRRGQSDPGNWFVLMDGSTLVHLLLNAGYGNPAPAGAAQSSATESAENLARVPHIEWDGKELQ